MASSDSTAIEQPILSLHLTKKLSPSDVILNLHQLLPQNRQVKIALLMFVIIGPKQSKADKKGKNKLSSQKSEKDCGKGVIFAKSANLSRLTLPMKSIVDGTVPKRRLGLWKP